MKQEKSCGAIVFYGLGAEQKVLLIRHVNGGHWSFPKGHVESGEVETQTALREIREETGLAVTIDTGFRRVTTYSPAPEISKDVAYFIARSKEEKLRTQPEEVIDAGWYLPGEAKDKITYPADRCLFEEALAYLAQHGIGRGCG